jgi:hypothetical protein
MEKSKAYRQKSIDRISSPDQLQDYMRVTNPGVWMVLAAVIVLLAGIFVATVFGRLESTYTARAKIQDGKAVLLIEGEAADEVDEGMTLRIKNEQAKIEDVYWVTQDTVEAVARINLPDGNYDAQVVMEVISPISFLTN